MSLALSRSTTSTLAEGRQVHVAVASVDGPHVTPELYAWSGGRLWFASARGTLKANVLGRDPALGAVVSVPGRSVMLVGEVEVYDPLDPVGLARAACGLPAAARALADFGVRNAPDLLAFGADLVTGRLGWRPPPARVLFALDPRCALGLENGVIVDAAGDWSTLAAEAAAELVVVDDAEHADQSAGGAPAVLAVPGPVALPGRWFGDRQVLELAPALLPLVPSGRFDLSVVVDEYSAPGPAAKQGTLLRGRGRLARGGAAAVEVDPERQVQWDGVDTESEPI
jgi:hypothetical protein